MEPTTQQTSLNDLVRPIVREEVSNVLRGAIRGLIEEELQKMAGLSDQAATAAVKTLASDGGPLVPEPQKRKARESVEPIADGEDDSGGLTVAQAAREAAASTALIYKALRLKQLASKQVPGPRGKMHLIPRAALAKWQQKRADA